MEEWLEKLKHLDKHVIKDIAILVAVLVVLKMSGLSSLIWFVICLPFAVLAVLLCVVLYKQYMKYGND